MRHLCLVGVCLASLCVLAVGCGTKKPPTATVDGGPNGNGANPFGNAGGTSGGTCGNGVIDAPTEVCDGLLLNNSTCATFGYSAGTLLCDARTCSFDMSMCTGQGGQNGGGTGG